jgi:hypothetical protein
MFTDRHLEVPISNVSWVTFEVYLITNSLPVESHNCRLVISLSMFNMDLWLKICNKLLKMFGNIILKVSVFSLFCSLPFCLGYLKFII